MTKNVLTPLAERFYARVEKTDSGCWRWTGALTRSGYGVIGRGRRSEGIVMAHRLSYEIHHGEIEAGRLVCHTCSKRWCVNPAHLFAGTHSENLRQAYAEGARGVSR